MADFELPSKSILDPLTERSKREINLCEDKEEGHSKSKSYKSVIKEKETIEGFQMQKKREGEFFNPNSPIRFGKHV